MIAKASLTRRAALLGLGAAALSTKFATPALAQNGDWKAEVLSRARAHDALRSLIVARQGDPLIEEVFSGASLDRGVNVKSASKTILASLIGIAIGKGLLEGPDQPIAPLLSNKLPDNPDPRLARVTIGNLLSMQSGLERTSGPNYGRWVQSRDWVRFALAQPFVDEPGGRMLYSTGNTHLLSAILTRVADASTLEVARDWLGEPLDITVPSWPRDPQGIYFGGNDMVLSPRALIAFGQMIHANGKVGEEQIVPADWIAQSWIPRTSSPWTGHEYGYGWFLRQSSGLAVRYAWGYGGQMLFVVPQAGITCTMISDPNAPSGRNGYVQDLHALFDLIVERVTKAA
jgi:CubicO group peptidase (beta-lactamase class C family)